MMRIALTCDDAPTIAAGPPHVQRDPRRMDQLRAMLQRRGVVHCAAFVIGAEVEDDGPLRRWLEAGYTLGNHTWGHEAASTTDADAFMESVARCDERLADVGAFEGEGPKWFRFPFLDHGPTEDTRRALGERLAKLGYATAHATVDLFDDRFEPAFGRARSSLSTLHEQLVGARYRRAAHRALARARAEFGPAVPQVPYFHFGGVSTRFLEGIVQRWLERGAQLCSLSEALSHPALVRDTGTGLVQPPRTASVAGRLAHKVAQKAKRLANAADPTRGGVLGPPYPRVR